MLRTAFLFAICFFCIQGMSQPIVGNMTYRDYPSRNGNPRFGLLEFLPKDYTQNGSYKHPLIIYLHGLGDWGNGTMDPDPDVNNPTGVIIGKLTLGGIPELIRLGATMQFEVHGRKGSFVVLAPQVNNSVAAVPSSPGPWQPFYIRALVDSAKRHLNIDPNKIFVVGHSYGGYGAYVFAGESQANANEIAGVIPVCGADGRNGYPNLTSYYVNAQVGVLAIHSTDDNLVPDNGAQNLVNDINSNNPLIRAQRITQGTFGGGHEIYRRNADTTVFYAYDTTNRYMYPNIYQWMLGVDKARIVNGTLTSNSAPVADLGVGGGDTTILVSPNRFGFTLNASKSVDNSDVIVRYQWELLSSPPGTTASDFRRLKDFFQNASFPIEVPQGSFLFSRLGTYTFRLTLTDLYGAVTTTNKVITLSKGSTLNMPPAIETVYDEVPGSRVIDSKPDTLTINGSAMSVYIDGKWFDWESFASSGGNPFSTMEVVWRVISKPPGGTVVLPNLSEVGTISGLTDNGVYVLELRFEEKANRSIISRDTLYILRNLALPANLRSFKGRTIGTINELNWSTASEFNVSHFELERSADGRDFQRIARINASAGNSTAQRNYTYRDDQAPRGKIYYRLRIVDLDGSFKRSGTIQLHNDGKGMAVNVFPNPVKDQLSIQMEGPFMGLLKYKIYTSAGVLVYDGTWKKTQWIQTLQHPTVGWSKGLHIIELQSETGFRQSFQLFKD